MSQPPYPPPGGSDTGGGAQPYPGAGSPPPGGTAGYKGPPRYDHPVSWQAPYGQPGYGQARPGATVPPWGRAESTAATSSGVALALAAALGVLLAAAAVGLFLVFGSEDGSGLGSALPPATSEPEGLGDDAELDDYAQECHGGDMGSCDDLFSMAPRGSAYELYGGTCAGRQSNTDAREVYCVEAFPPPS